MKAKIIYLAVAAYAVLLCSCSDFLSEKPDRNIVIPSTLNDFQALLDNSPIMNTGTGHLLGEISGDNLEVEKEAWSRLSSAYEKNSYIWAKDIFEGAASTDWNNPSMVILYSNLALEGADKVSRDPEPELWDNVRGSALFYRANAFLQLAQLFCKEYNPQTASQDPGIPLRLDSDITVKSNRYSVEQTYKRIVEDLSESIELLPAQPIAKTRPSRAAACALLARVYLLMGQYDFAVASAEQALSDYSTLIDYNTIDTTLAYPFSNRDEEILFFSTTLTPSILNPNIMDVAKDLYSSYSLNDLRKYCYYTTQNGRVKYKGAYSSTVAFFTGISTGEVWITLAEAYARTGDLDKAKTALQKLMRARYANGSLPQLPQQAGSLLYKILEERRKELPFRGLRWPDLKRLNRESTFAKTVTRNWGSETITLQPGSQLYIFPFPDAVVKITGMPQNIR